LVTAGTDVRWSGNDALSGALDRLELEPGQSTIGKTLRIALAKFRKIHNLFGEHLACTSRIAVNVEGGLVGLDSLPRRVQSAAQDLNAVGVECWYGDYP
jgi:hypothetical protein